MWTTVGRKNKQLTTSRNSDELQDEEYCEEDAKSKSESTFLSEATAKKTTSRIRHPRRYLRLPAAVAKHRPAKIE